MTDLPPPCGKPAAAFFRVNETQQLHVTEWKDSPSFRGHVCLRVDDWMAAFRRFKELGVIDIKPWGKARKLPDGTFQMFIRDPSGTDLGRGLSAYAIDDARRIIGHKSREIERILGYRGRDEMIHRDDLALWRSVDEEET